MNPSYINYLKATKKSDNTIRDYTKYTQAMLDYVGKPDTEITFFDLMNYQASISHLSPNTVRLHLAAIKSYFNFLEKGKIIIDNPASQLDRPKANPKPKNYMSAEDVSAMIANARTPRDVAIVKFMVSTGVRISELINITLDEYYEAIRTTREITIHGKGNKDRRIYINDGVEEAVEKYLDKRCDDCPYLFTTFRRTQIDPESLSKTLKNMAKKAGIPFWEDISNHCMRAAFATIATRRGVDVDTISKAMGHSSLAVTSVYIKNAQANINNAMNVMAF